MIRRISKKIVLKYEDRIFDLPDELKNKIDLFWQKSLEENPALYNGDDYVVEKYEEDDNQIVMHVVKTKYSHYLYDERVGIHDEKYRCISPYGGLLILTKDNYWVIGQMAKHTSFSCGFQIPGGSIDKNDIKDGSIDINENLKREVREEVNLDIDQISYKFEFMECPTEKRNAYGFLAIGKLDMSKDELEKHFEDYQKYLIENNLEVEFEKLLYIKHGNAVQELDKYDNPKRPFLRDLLIETDKGDGPFLACE